MLKLYSHFLPKVTTLGIRGSGMIQLVDQSLSDVVWVSFTLALAPYPNVRNTIWVKMCLGSVIIQNQSKDQAKVQYNIKVLFFFLESSGKMYMTNVCMQFDNVLDQN